MPRSAALSAPPQQPEATYTPLTPSFLSLCCRTRRRYPRVPERVLLVPRRVREHRRARRCGDDGGGAMAATAVRGAQGLGGRESRRRATKRWRAGEGVRMHLEDVIRPGAGDVGGADRGDWHAVAESAGDVGLAVWVFEAAGRGRGAGGVAGVICAVVAWGMSVGSSCGEVSEGTVD